LLAFIKKFRFEKPLESFLVSEEFHFSSYEVSAEMVEIANNAKHFAIIRRIASFRAMKFLGKERNWANSSVGIRVLSDPSAKRVIRFAPIRMKKNMSIQVEHLQSCQDNIIEFLKSGVHIGSKFDGRIGFAILAGVKERR
jgi:hypothetical protein